MEEQKDNKETNVTQEASAPDSLPDNIEKLLQERKKIDDMLKEKFTKQVTVMFTDIKGSTSFFESRGDIEGTTRWLAGTRLRSVRFGARMKSEEERS